ncbi:pH-gated potassium channel KcsA [Streptomyces sulfonofaciens]|uniref:PH-gated potassium channel KcsA n=1 Tax=Streptomyces sulfonofaciens TaxID=68272 RepID=A0A919FYX1_9ACTN|nr:potassium channel family protein [Streptomyces sulfonofaciens]GHH74523.1 pH-gated potassium channel KcsA [Streptomyces sulfonofaciens]
MPPSSFLYVLRRLLRSARGGSRHVRAAAWATGFTALFLLAGSWAIVPVEEGAPRATLTTFPRALWWSIETATTVGYGDFFPVTAGGRVIAALMMLVGIAAFSIVTAAIATWFVDRAAGDMRRMAAEADRLEHGAESKAVHELHSLHDRFDHVEELLRAPGPTGRTR